MHTAEPTVSGERRRPKRVRSKVTSLARDGVFTWLENRDKRGPVARRFADLAAEWVSDQGGPGGLSEAQRQLIRRCSALATWCESEEAKMADGEDVDIDRYQRTSNSLRRLCESLGIERKQRDPFADLTGYINDAKRKEAADE